MDIDPSTQSADNDLDYPTFNILMSIISKNIHNHLIPKPQFILILGDLVGHIRSHSNSVLESESSVFNRFSDDFKDIPVFYVFGNNDSFSQNYGKFHDPLQQDQFKSPFDVAVINAGWKNGFLSTGVLCPTFFKSDSSYPCLIDYAENIYSGYYSAYLSKKLRLIVLNTVLFSDKSPKNLEQDAFAELQWFSDQLNSSKINKEYVLIAMHIPPGNNIYDHSPFWRDDYLKIFLRTLSIYHHGVVGVLASHTHTEEIKILNNIQEKYKIGVYYTPGLSTSHGNAASVKMFSLSSDSRNKWMLTNAITYYFSGKDTDELTLNKLYDFESYYCQRQVDKYKYLNNMTNCLSNVTIDKIKRYNTAGNDNFLGIVNSPADIILNF